MYRTHHPKQTSRYFRRPSGTSRPVENRQRGPGMHQRCCIVGVGPPRTGPGDGAMEPHPIDHIVLSREHDRSSRQPRPLGVRSQNQRCKADSHAGCRSSGLQADHALPIVRAPATFNPSCAAVYRRGPCSATCHPLGPRVVQLLECPSRPCRQRSNRGRRCPGCGSRP